MNLRRGVSASVPSAEILRDITQGKQSEDSERNATQRPRLTWSSIVSESGELRLSACMHLATFPAEPRAQRSSGSIAHEVLPERELRVLGKRQNHRKNQHEVTPVRQVMLCVRARMTFAASSSPTPINAKSFGGYAVDPHTRPGRDAWQATVSARAPPGRAVPAGSSARGLPAEAKKDACSAKKSLFSNGPVRNPPPSVYRPQGGPRQYTHRAEAEAARHR